MKRFSTFALVCLWMTFGVGSLYAEEFSGYCGAEGDGSNLQWELDPAPGILTITGSGKMASWYLAQDRPWNERAYTIHQVILPEGLTNIGDYAFHEMRMSAITIPSTVTEIGEQAFMYCKWLESIDLPSSVTTLKRNAFFGCQRLVSVQLPSQLQVVPSCCFASCTSLQTITIPASVNAISSDAFKSCNALSSFVVEAGNTVYCSYDDVLYTADSTQIVAFPQGKTGSHTTPMPLVHLPAQSIDGANIDTLYLPGVQTIDARAIAGCGALKAVFLSETVENIVRNAFSQNSGLVAIHVAEQNAHYLSLEGVLYSKDTTVLLKYPEAKPIPLRDDHALIPTIHDSVRVIASYAFGGLQTPYANQNDSFCVNLPPYLETIESDAFSNLYNQIVVNAYNGHIPTLDRWAFPYYTGKEDIHVYVPFLNFKAWKAAPVWSEMNVKWRFEPTYSGPCGEDVQWTYTVATKALSFSGTGDMYAYTSEDQVPWDLLRGGVTSCTFGESVTSICDYAFWGDTMMTVLPDLTSIVSIGKCAFVGVPLHNSTFTGSEALRSIGDSAFLGWERLQYFQPVEGIEHIGQYAFYNCTKCGFGQTMPKSLKYIGDYAFAVPKSAKKSLPAMPDSLQYIGRGAFLGRNVNWTNLLTLPSDLTYIGDSAFADATSVTQLVLSNDTTPAQIGLHSFPQTLEKVMVPYGSLSAYQAADYWKDLNCHVADFVLQVYSNAADVIQIAVQEGWDNPHFAKVEAEGYTVQMEPYNQSWLYTYIDSLSPNTTYDLTLYVVTKEGDREPFHHSVTTREMELYFSDYARKNTLFRLRGSANNSAEEGFGFEAQAYYPDDAPYGDTITIPAAAIAHIGYTDFSADATLPLLPKNEAYYYRFRPFWHDALADTTYYGEWQYKSGSSSDAVEYITPMIAVNTQDVGFNTVTLQATLQLRGSMEPTSYTVQIIDRKTWSTVKEMDFPVTDSIQQLLLTDLQPETKYELYVYLNAVGYDKVCSIESSITVTTLPAPRYTITFVNWDGAELAVLENVVHGTLPTYAGATPVRPEDETYIYTFSGWTPEIVAAEADATYTATYEATPKPEGIENIQHADRNIQKVLMNGQLYIFRGGKCYTIQGQEVGNK